MEWGQSCKQMVGEELTIKCEPEKNYHQRIVLAICSTLFKKSEFWYWIIVQTSNHNHWQWWNNHCQQFFINDSYNILGNSLFYKSQSLWNYACAQGKFTHTQLSINLCTHDLINTSASSSALYTCQWQERQRSSLVKASINARAAAITHDYYTWLWLFIGPASIIHQMY